MRRFLHMEDENARPIGFFCAETELRTAKLNEAPKKSSRGQNYDTQRENQKITNAGWVKGWAGEPHVYGRCCIFALHCFLKEHSREFTVQFTLECAS